MPQLLPSSPLSCPKSSPLPLAEAELAPALGLSRGFAPLPAPFEPVRVSYRALGMFLPPVCLYFLRGGEVLEGKAGQFIVLLINCR